jgi:hypothetical protein
MKQHRSHRRPIRHLLAILTIALITLACVVATERSTPHNRDETFVSPSRATLAYQRKALRAIARVRGTKRDNGDKAGEECFATTEEEAHERIIQKISPDLASADVFSMGVSMAGYVCTEGLTKTERDTILEAFRRNFPLKPQISLNTQFEPPPDEEQVHALIENELGRDRYLQHIATCVESENTSYQQFDDRVEETMAGVLHLTEQQRAALREVSDKVRKLSSRRNNTETSLNLDENLSLSPESLFEERQRALLSVAQEGFAILTEEQARIYRTHLTTTFPIFDQMALSSEYLPDPEQVRADLERDELVPAQILKVRP